MARIETDPNYSSPTFSRATAGTDLVKKEDIQALAAAMSTHDHTTGKGVPATATNLAPTVSLAAPTTSFTGGNLVIGGTVSMTGPCGIAGDLTLSGNESVLGGTLNLGASAGNQGQMQLFHPNGRASRLRGGAAALEYTNAANSTLIGNLDDTGNAMFTGNLTLNTAVSTSINFGDNQMIAAGATTIQTNGKLCLGVGPNGYRLVLPNTATGEGQGYANAWVTYACIDHAREANLSVQAVDDPLGKVQAIQGYYYDHISFDSEGAPMTDEGGAIESNPTYGFAPSEVQPLLPELVAADGNGVDMTRMVVILWEAVRQLAAAQTQPA